MRHAACGMDVQARLKPLKPYPWLKLALSKFAPPDRPKYYRIVCGQMIEGRDGPQPCPQSLGTVEPAGVRPGQVSRATKLRFVDGLPPVKPSDWIMHHDGWYDRDASGAYVLVHRRPKPARPGWRRSENPHYPVGRRPLPEQVKRALAGTGIEHHPDGDYQIVGHVVILPAILVCPRCGARNHADRPYDLEPYWQRRTAGAGPVAIVTDS